MSSPQTARSVARKKTDASHETSPTFTVRDLRRRWKPIKERLNAQQDSHPTAIRVHRAFSWMARVEELEDGADLDIALICRWIGFNALYGQWDEEKQEPSPDCKSWQQFLGRVLKLDESGHVGDVLTKHKKLVMSILDDEYLSRFFWEEPSDVRARKSKKAKYDAQTWYLEKRWVMVLDRLVERIYLMRCQLMHGAATFGGKLNRVSLRHCSVMLGHLLQATMLVLTENGADEDWGAMCYPPLR
jgi:hypothetical protein